MTSSRPRPLRLSVVESNGTGGMIHYAYQLCTALAAQGVEVSLITSDDYELDGLRHDFRVAKLLRHWPLIDPRAAEVPSTGLARTWRALRRSVRRAGRGFQLVLDWIRLTRYLLANRPDVVQFGRIHFAFERFFLRLLRRRGLILTQICHEFELRERVTGRDTALARRLWRGVYRNFSAIFLHGVPVRDRFLTFFDVSSARTHVIDHGNEALFERLAGGPSTRRELSQRYGLGGDEPVALFFGTLAPSKGLPVLLQAFARVRGRLPRAKLLIVGYPSKHLRLDELVRAATDLGLGDAARFDFRYLPLQEVAPLMALATVVVCPYLSGTQSGAVQVAYACGRPVVATRVGALSEVVEDGRSGLLVAPGSPDELAAAIVKILDTPDLATEMGRYARHLSKTRHAWEPIGARILTVYRQLVATSV